MSHYRILIVEDESLVARDLQSTLERLGYQVLGPVRNSAEAVALAATHRPHLVLMDVRLADGSDGIQAAAQIQQAENIPVVYLTAHADEQTVQRARETHPYGYLLKPFHESELKTVVELAIGRHQANMQLVASEAQFVNTLRSMAEGVISTDLLGRINFLNPTAERLTGWTQAEALGHPLHEVFRVSSPAGEEPDLLLGAGNAAKRSIVLTNRQGRQVLIEDNTAPIRDPEGGLAGIVVLFREKAVEPASADADSPSGEWPNLAGLVQSIADPLFALDSSWHITYLNPQSTELLDGKHRESLLGRNLWEILPPSVYRRYYNEFSQALNRNTARTFEMELEARNQWFVAQVYPFSAGLLVLLHDVTARKLAEEKERKMEKLESLGVLARGFAHDFNNLLTVLLGNLSLAEMQMSDAAPGRAEVTTAKQATLQAQGLVQHLLTFAKGGAPIKQPTDLGRLVGDWAADWPRKNRVEYRIDVSKKLCQGDVDRQQFQRMLHNLVRNSEQAIHREGIISIRLCPAQDFADLPPSSLPTDANPAEWVILQVSDNGEGIAEEILGQIFEPYFTTRADANASGLGLTVCESIIKAHGATLTLESQRGEGTTATIAVPVYHGAAEHLPVSRTDPAKPAIERPASRRVLILEDEPLIRRLITSNLTNAGCEVEQTADGADTVEVYRKSLESGTPFDLLIMDLSIPGGVGGLQAMEQLRQLDPDVMAIVSSGYSDDPVMQRYLDYGFRARLPKPYQPSELRELVNGLLSER